ncbi:MAG: hypothetical protein CO098_14200 [Bacteroidetes bacterium CG_4_9_14_3_um_filter_41_19]|nr:MAG: hypothetical protein CO098_14200 [Bacteroidetes bacterium CG_4_9_14_3_um_filter_41_19]
MKRWIFNIILGLLLAGNAAFSQQQEDALHKKFNYRVGNLGFAADSIDLIIPDVPQGVVTKYSLEVYNFGTKPIALADGRASRFVSSSPNPAVLMPQTSGTIMVELNIVKELPFGPFKAEVSLDTDDATSKYKFLNLLTNIVVNTEKSGESIGLDTIPRLFFDSYNYDFGYLNRGKRLYHSFRYTNVGGMPVVISYIDVSPDCRMVVAPNKIIHPGESGMIRLKLILRGRVGVQHRSVILTTNDPVTPVITLGLHGNVRKDSPSKSNPNFCNESPGRF